MFGVRAESLTRISALMAHSARAIFVTSGRLTSEQQREAGEASIVVIEGRTEIDRIAREYEYDTFDWPNPADASA